MKSNIPRQYIYIIAISLFLFIFVLIFSFTVLIPKGKEYRLQRTEIRLINRDLGQSKELESKTLSHLKKLQHTNRRVISAFDTIFNPSRFEEENKKWFSKLTVSKVSFLKVEGDFAVYEVNTSSEINSPKSFYDFLDAVNKSDWIIGVNFPINFKRKGKLIDSSFRMKVYCNSRDTNASASRSEAK